LNFVFTAFSEGRLGDGVLFLLLVAVIELAARS
jgi:hypothetical protein